MHSHASYESEYILPANATDTGRLNLQHKLVTHALGDRLWAGPPNITSFQGADILDSGTGTGIWLKELTQRLKAANVTPSGLYGIDINTQQFPKDQDESGWCHFSVSSATAMPSEWTSKFTFIHQRLLVAGFKKQDWLDNLQEIHRVLKLNGHVFFTESDYFNIRNSCENPSDRLATLGKKVLESRGMVPNIMDLLPDMLKQAGFVDIVAQDLPIDVCSSRSKWGQEGAAMLIDALGKFEPALIQLGIIPSSAEYKALLRHTHEQWDREKTWHPFRTVSARKA